MNIIGICGLAGSGKDTAADILLENEGFVKIAFADPIKRFAMEMWGFSEEQVFGPSEFRTFPDKRYNINGEYLTPRKVLQHIGTEIGRVLDPDVWARYAINISKTLLTQTGWCYSQVDGLQSYWEDTSEGTWDRIEGFPKKVKAVIISDVRFYTEIKHIKEANGKIIRIIRPKAGLKGKFALHKSETEMSDIPDSEFDFVIQNCGTLNDLRGTIEGFVSTL